MNDLAQRSFPDFRPPIVLPAIQELIVFYGSSSLVTQAVTYLLHNLVMPQLRRLRLPRTIQQHIPTPFLGDLATRSPLIEDLSLNLSGLTHDSLVETLTMLPGLKRLVICDASDGDTNATVQHLFTSLMQQSREPPFPLLAEMQLKECHLWVRRRKRGSLGGFWCDSYWSSAPAILSVSRLDILRGDGPIGRRIFWRSSRHAG
ncbi:hypothetical protein DFH06DRAFT_1237059 [Mycena polygramma]|nr:hypothetical protein DFH06DRAFT_1237059 [Mycena polygramma]